MERICFLSTYGFSFFNVPVILRIEVFYYLFSIRAVGKIRIRSCFFFIIFVLPIFWQQVSLGSEDEIKIKFIWTIFQLN